MEAGLTMAGSLVDWDGPADFGDSSTVEAAPDRMLSVIRGRSRISWRFAQGPLVSTPTT